MRQVSEQFDRNTVDAIRRAALAADAAVVLATPVDTGRARANWLVSINSVDELITEKTDKGGAGAIAAGKAVIESWYLGAGPIFISNSVPYIIPLEEGHSKQAPAGMSKFALAAARAQLVRAGLLKGI
jgi:hypothetical protein